MKPTSINHLDDEQLTDAYYGELEVAEHLSCCKECRDRMDRLREVLDAFNGYPIPLRDPTHGATVWTNLRKKLPPDKRERRWLQWWILTRAFAASLIIAFVIGRLTEPTHRGGVLAPAAISETARERVLLMSLSEHLEQSQIILSNVENARPGSPDLRYERDRAHELIGANRLLRQTATRLGDLSDAALLDELERVLLDFANSGEVVSPAGLARTQREIQRSGLLFKVRVSSVASRERGEQL
ncbi:MAG TPA: hypothetical protein VHZ55_09630 [Bryobacteraceae bacterium]|nr:hypothetical protein [Bryobacteraceae bacterium]